MNRAHSAKESKECIVNAKALGFSNITLDLIYGMPNLSNEEWKKNINQAVDLGVGHISAYNLTMEQNTAYAHYVKKGIYEAPSDEKGAEQFQILIERLKIAGYLQYETSNFAKSNQYSKHNSSYWKGKKYLGIGPSAHSFNGESRQWNVSNNKKYIDAIANNVIQYEQEELTNNDKVNEHLLIGLRTIWGCDMAFIKENVDQKLYLNFLNELVIQKEHGFVVQEEEQIFLTEQGKLFADRVASDLFIEK
jgi:oxygen-independent coproporphyrinogen-3 oxidase